MKLCFEKSFSLIELLTGLIVVSLLLSAFAPLITKKLKASDITLGNFGNEGQVIECKEGYHQIGNKCYVDIENCIDYGVTNKCIACYSDYVLYNNACYVSISNCETQKGDTCTVCSTGYETTSDGSCIQSCNCTNGTCSTGTTYCSSCNSGYALYNNQCIMISEPSSQEDCDPYNALFIDKSKNDGKTNICAMKYNIGDVYLDPVVRVVPVGTTCTGKYCCWQGETSDTCTDTGNGSTVSYSGCNRTLCNREASNISCNTYAPDEIKGLWRLPTKEEIAGWSENLNYLNHNKGAQGLMLCDDKSSEYGSVKCWAGMGKCMVYTSMANNCDPSYLLSSAINTSGLVSSYYLKYGEHILLETGNILHSYSARCVTDKVLK